MTESTLGRWLLLAAAILAIALAVSAVSAHDTAPVPTANDTTQPAASNHSAETHAPHTAAHSDSYVTIHPGGVPPSNASVSAWNAWMAGHMVDHMGPGSIAWMEEHMGVSVDDVGQRTARNQTGDAGGYQHESTNQPSGTYGPGPGHGCGH